MIPRATYRLQFHWDFAFEAAVPLASYFAKLGISHVYSSPILKARPGSLHGYDVVDPGVVNPELGGEDGFRRLAAALHAQDIGIILDIVPNHMAVHPQNRWWMDVLQNGPGSDFADYFDIDWQTDNARLDGKVLLPVFGKPYWQALKDGELRIVREESGAGIAYFDKRFPLRPEDRDAVAQDFATPERLHALLERQHYRLAWWRSANDELNWRRFFEINDLVALNAGRPEVFEASHRKILALFEEGLIDGVRVDHIDGLADPRGYCRMLRARLDEAAKRRPHNAERGAPYIVVEKILGKGESLPADWGVDGTTGYDFMNDVSALQHDGDGAVPLADLWHALSGRSGEFQDEENIARPEILKNAFASALHQATRHFFALTGTHEDARDVTQQAIRRALTGILIHLRVYRTYATGAAVSPEPGSHFEQAAQAAKRDSTPLDAAAIDFIAGVLHTPGTDAAIGAVRRFNQLAAPVAAKAVEDTAFYRYGRLLSRNDVGFQPGDLAIDADEFHHRSVTHASSFPHALLATATHDHKRGEDARARLAVLSEIPHAWEEAVQTWLRMNASRRTPQLALGDEYQLYQTLLGAWPLDLDWRDAAQLAAFRERILAWREKSLREQKLTTSWLNPDAEFEQANADFVRAVLDGSKSSEFLSSFAEFVERIAPAGALNGLMQVTLRCTVSGVPDCYQGTEFWDFSLVDPDNRRPVNYRARAEALSADATLEDLLACWQDGRVKQHVITELLRLRARKPQLFAAGQYIPLAVEGERSEHVLGFARVWEKDALCIAVPLHCAEACHSAPLPPPEFWGDTEVFLPAELASLSGSHLFDANFRAMSHRLGCADLFARFPVAVLT
ncbi:MAG TPA: malto-oligosyltrehalose synthase [Rhizomicrobium sp.]|jgi:(1->4)-alpha-D-glucan 1-alpha-D-glucosylmutase